MLVKSKPLSIARAKVTKTDGSVEVYYSVPDVPFWNLKGRLWLKNRLKAMREEDKI